MKFLRSLLRLLAPKDDAPGGASYLSAGERLDKQPTFEREMRTRTDHLGGGGGA
ncbi:hypothetical protein NF556_20095 [Ornithinimicrobium faecis]|uniref:Uncharacterized protein n=1 Tax=Ornithinimicrobium faecis TaxID=2934158 RepID=A0ABY4YSW5_9MICO|nr:hypothetical protein [Ornithinimicrobium sp. HY1793]USQ79858.1 hypothetical protein NF556_20095 [Ornithinimicrobium sp. HY1793]